MDKLTSATSLDEYSTIGPSVQRRHLTGISTSHRQVRCARWNEKTNAPCSLGVLVACFSQVNIRHGVGTSSTRAQQTRRIWLEERISVNAVMKETPRKNQNFNSWFIYPNGRRGSFPRRDSEGRSV